jgi:diguanylate cyclase (GGDEF)-like protein
LGPGVQPPDLDTPRVGKHSLSLVAQAMKRSLAAGIATELLDGPDEPVALMIGIFQSRAYFDQEELRYGALAAAGATVIVGCADGTPELASPLHGVDLAGRPELSRCWLLATVAGTAAAALVGVDDGRLVGGGSSLEASRSFLARWTFHRRDAIDTARQLLTTLAPRLATRTLSKAETALQRADHPAGATEEALATALEVVSPGLGQPRPARGFFGELRDPLLEVDLLTGVSNRRFLEHHLQSHTGESAARMLAMLVDVDDLAQLNSKLGLEAGDAALIGVASALRRECRPGDVLARTGDDEFLLLTQLDATATPIELATRLVGAVRAMRLPRPFETERVTVSVGAVLADPTRLPHDRLKDALQLAKLLGKDGARLVE